MKQKILSIILLAVLLSGCSLPGFLQKKFGALQITTKPESEVYLDDEKVGETPFKSEKLKVKDYKVRLVPKESNLAEWRTEITLYPSITTVINYDFAPDLQQSSGVVISLEPLSNKDSTEIAVISIPDNASVKLDNQPKGFTPLQLKSIPEGDHVLLIAAPGYQQRQVDIKTVKGHKLTVDVQLAKELIQEPEASPAAEEETSKSEEKAVAKEEKTTTPTPTPVKEKTASPSAEIERPYVQILETPTGWLRVRSEPNTDADNEVAKVYPDEKYKYLEADDSGWYKISIDEKTEGWISARYAKLFK